MDGYESDLWPLVYDQYNHGRHEMELELYSVEVAQCCGPILEAACGTGMILLPLLAQGLDMYGFDISRQMLEVLFAKAAKLEIHNIQSRVSRQDMTTFRYDMRFDAILIPARSFLHLTTREAQEACLSNVARHLEDGGRAMLNFFTPNEEALSRFAEGQKDWAPFETYKHPETGEDVRVSRRLQSSMAEQLFTTYWRFEFGGSSRETQWTVRWIHRQEFESLAEGAGLRVAGLYGGFKKEPYDGKDEMYWVLEKR